jgi:hypothetical protein
LFPGHFATYRELVRQETLHRPRRFELQLSPQMRRLVWESTSFGSSTAVGSLVNYMFDCGEYRFRVFCDQLQPQQPTLSWYHQY